MESCHQDLLCPLSQYLSVSFIFCVKNTWTNCSETQVGSRVDDVATWQRMSDDSNMSCLRTRPSMGASSNADALTVALQDKGLGAGGGYRMTGAYSQGWGLRPVATHLGVNAGGSELPGASQCPPGTRRAASSLSSGRPPTVASQLPWLQLRSRGQLWAQKGEYV